MASVKIDSFGGIDRKHDPKKAPFWRALVAENCFLDGNRLDVFYGLQPASNALTGASARKTIYILRSGNRLEWTQEVDVAASPLADDDEMRVYYTGDGEPRVTNNALAGSALTVDGQEGLAVAWSSTASPITGLDAAFFQTIAAPLRVILADDYLEYDAWIANGASVVGATPHLQVPTANINTAATIADSAANSITGDIEVQVDFVMQSYGPTASGGQNLIRKDGGVGLRSWQLVILDGGTPRWITSVDGTASTINNSCSATLTSAGLVEGSRFILKITHDVDDGAGHNVVKFWYSTDNGASWLQLGATATNAGTTSIFDSAQPVTIGDTGLISKAGLSIYRAKLFAGIGGTLKQDFNPALGVDAAATLADAVSGTWSIGADSVLIATGVADGGIRLVTNTGNTLAAITAADGYRATKPAAAFDALARGKWASRKIALASLVGQTVSTISVGGDNDALGGHKVIYRNIRFTNGAGTDRLAIWPPVLGGSLTSEPSFNIGDVSVNVRDGQVVPTRAYPAQCYVLGIPVPARMRYASATGGSGSVQTRAYVYTYVTPWGEESAPSEPTTIDANETGSTVFLDGIGVTARNMPATEVADSGVCADANVIVQATFQALPAPGYMDLIFGALSWNKSLDYQPGDRCHFANSTNPKAANKGYVVTQSGALPAGDGVRIIANVWDSVVTAYLFRALPINNAAVLGVTNLTGSVKVQLSAVEGLRVGEEVTFSGVAGMTDLNTKFAISAVTQPGSGNPGSITVPLNTAQVYTSGGTMTRVAKHNTGQRRITNVTFSSGVAYVTCDSTAELKVGDRVLIIAVQGAYQLNGVRAVASIIGPTIFTVAIATLGNYMAGGVVCPAIPYIFDEYAIASMTSAGGPYPTPYTWTIGFKTAHNLIAGDMVVGYDMSGAQEAWTVLSVAVVPNSTTITVSTACALSAYVSGGFIAPCGLQSRKRIYRTALGSVGAEYQLVDEIPADQCSYSDAFNDADLGEVLETDDWIQPPTDMHSIQAHPHSFLQGAQSNTMLQSVPGAPHAWPVKYQQNVPVSRIVGLGIVGTTAVALTEDVPHLFSGADPGSMRRERMDVGEPCTSKGSIVSTGRGVAYRGRTGVFLVGYEGGGVNSTREFLPETDFAGSAPDIASEYWGNKLYWIERGATTGYVLDPAAGGHALTQFAVDKPIYDFAKNPVDGNLWASYMDGANPRAAAIFTSSFNEPSRFDYETQYIRFPKPVALGFLQVDFDWDLQSDAMKARKSTIIANRRLRASAFAALNDVEIGAVAIGGDAIESPASPDTSLVVPTERYLKVTVLANPDNTDRVVTVFDDFVTDKDPVRLDDGVKSDVWQVKLVGNCPVSAVMLASSIRELRAM